MLVSNYSSLILGYSSRNDEFRNVPLKLIVTLPDFSRNQINMDELYEQFGTSSAYPIATEKQNNAPVSDEDFSLSIEKVFLDEPRIITDINLLYCNAYNVCCKNDEEIWTSGDDNYIELYNLQGNRVRSTVNKFGFMPRDIAVDCSGDLLSVIERNKCVNIVDRKNRYKVFREHG